MPLTCNDVTRFLALVTLMTAGIVIALWAVASDQIVQIFENAMAPFLGGSL